MPRWRAACNSAARAPPRVSRKPRSTGHACLRQADRLCTRADIANVLRAAPCPTGALVAEVVNGLRLLVLDGHGFPLDCELVFRAESGAACRRRSSPNDYYAIPLRLDVSRCGDGGGAAINLTSAASWLVTSPLPWAAAIEWGRNRRRKPRGTVTARAPYPKRSVRARRRCRLALELFRQRARSLNDVVSQRKRV